ncbi:MAG TPA: hypothetical protein VFQ61_31390 [Polyangiaceae bacterium]|nr:hypothetical protein [Polyangiaceae bacterium]
MTLRWILPCGLWVLVSACGSSGEPNSVGTGGGPSGGNSATGSTDSPVHGGGETAASGGSEAQGGQSSGSGGATQSSCSTDSDSCPDGSYCDGASCVQGCKAATDCQSGVCGDDHSCESCQSDSECSEGLLCSSGTCLEPCEEDGDSCGDGRTCCGGRCVDTARDIQHCGACGGKGSDATCSSAEFCGGESCVPLTLASICEHTEVLLMEDEFEADGEAGKTIAMALAAHCPSKPKVKVVPQGEATASNPMTGFPSAGPTRLVTLGGGPYGQLVAKYLEDNSIPPVRHGFVDGVYRFEKIKGGEVLASMPWDQADGTKDIVVVELTREPNNGTTVLIVSGFSAQGTQAGAWYFANVMLPQIDRYSAPYYVLNWTDGGENQSPDDSDQFQVIGSAP